MAISDWPVAERPRERLLSLGACALSDAELLALFLRTGPRGQSAVDLARALLGDFGGLRGLFGATRTEVCAVRGLGSAKYAQLQAVQELARRSQGGALPQGKCFESPDAVAQFLRAQLAHYPYEAFGCLWLDNRHRALGYDELFRGTVNGASVHPREVVRSALRRNAAAVVLAHNHPSGVAEPSAADRQITQRLRQALELIDVRTLDHFVVCESATASFAALGLL